MPWRKQLEQNLADRKAQNLWRERRQVTSAPGRQVSIDGQSFLNFCGNNYLSLSDHPDLIAAATAATKQFGVGTTGSHLIVGHTEIHHRLEEKLASFLGAEKALIFSTGYMANLAIPATFLGRNDLIIQDRLNHASIIDAAQMCRAKLRRYSHVAVGDAKQLLSQSAPHQRKMLITDGVFSMDGNLAPLKQLHQSCLTYESVMVVDDAHGFGVVGERGRGSLSHFQLQPTGNVLMLGTLSKAVGSFGAFVAGDSVYIDTLLQHARSFIYTTALPCSATAAAIKAIELLETESWRQEKLIENIALFRDLARAAGIPFTDTTTPIQPVIVGKNESALQIADHLKQSGVLAIAIRPPTVPVDQSRIRITLMTDHTETDIRYLVEKLSTAIMLTP